jgi:hypothetical protein
MALVPLASILKESGPGWAQTQQLQLQVATAMKSLIENIVVRATLHLCDIFNKFLCFKCYLEHKPEA